MKARTFITALFLLWPSIGIAQGVIPVALAQQQDLNGRPMAGALLYIYQVGTVATRQDSFQDFGLTLTNPWPLAADATGRIPMFYLANGQVHVRLTDAFGVVQFDYPTMQVVGPSTGSGGGGGGAVDPTSVASTGDVKFRMENAPVAGWVRANGLTIGNAVSGATGRANGDTQSLYIYLYGVCDQAHCQVLGGARTSALADYNAGRQLTLPDWRGRTPAGLDQMGAVAPAGRIAASNITSGGGDGVDTPLATGGAANHAMSLAELIQHNHTLTDPGHVHPIVPAPSRIVSLSNTSNNVNTLSPTAPNTPILTDTAMTGITIAPSGSASPSAFGTMAPFTLGSWHVKL